ncbi:protein kinase domain-containing protein [Haliangium sp.]|uniref:WD40 repeat domain-containing serine/threonine protein kinase n=1 Tax=Haliangium sp. TaxID=2663208 RepID=UPI003D0EBA43
MSSRPLHPDHPEFEATAAPEPSGSGRDAPARAARAPLPAIPSALPAHRRDAPTAPLGEPKVIVSGAERGPHAPGRRGTWPPPAPSLGSDDLRPGTRIDEYEIIRFLGEGGMGEVHLARDLRLGRRVAIKRLSTRSAWDTERFMEEARMTARCTHENIVVIYGAGEYAGCPYMALEYLEGQTLRQWLREHAEVAGARMPVPSGRAVELMLPVVRALAYAHANGIVHRDLKPENVMLTRAGGVKVLDFGIAKLMSTAKRDDGIHTEDPAGDDNPAGLETLRNSAILGTLPYMSPEQMNVRGADHRSDLWAVGIMLFELVAGRHPLPTRSVGDLMRVADTEEPMPSVRQYVPDQGRLAQIIDRCLIKDPAHRTESAGALLVELEPLAPGRGALRVGPGENPFAGLASFQESDADRFFGRDRDVDHLVSKLRSRSLVAVIGPSGAGKSSLIRAGVIPALKRSGEGWDTYVVRPGRAPLGALAEVLVQVTSTGRSVSGTDGDPEATLVDSVSRAVTDPIVDRLRAQPGYLGAGLRARATSTLRRALFFVDQFEELYTLGASADERTAFLACLAAVADDPTSPLRVLVSMRSDFLDRLAEDVHLSGEVTRGLVMLRPMGRAELRETLLRPVMAAEYGFAPPALVERMIDAIEAAPGALPLLQFTAARLWELRDTKRRLLTEASYEQLGGVAGALAMHADTVLAGMSSARQALARVVCERLVTPERTRAVASMVELHPLHSDPDAVNVIVQHLAAMRLVVIERGTDGEGYTVELAHESLIDRWPTLARWLAEDQEDAAMLARLRNAARDWERSGHAAGLLWTGAAAHEAKLWMHHYRGELAPSERRYLDAVLAAVERARRLRRRLAGGVLAAATAVAVVTSWLAWEATTLARQEAEARHAEGAARQAAAGAAVAAEKEAVRARDAARMVALRTMSADPTTQVALVREIEAADAPPLGSVDEAKRLLHAQVARVVFTDHDDGVRSASFSPDGTRVVSASSDKTVRVWNPDGSGDPIVLRGHDHRVWSASFSPDGARVVSASSDKTVRVWRADGIGAPIVLRGHDGVVLSASFSPDGARVVSASADKTVRVWRADGSGAPLVLRGHGDVVTAASFSPDGARIVTSSLDETVRVWNADGSGGPLVLRGHGDVVRSASFSPDGARVVSASADKTVRIWSADGGVALLVLCGHDDPVISASFSPDGARVVSGSWDRTVRIWNVDGSGAPLVLRGHDDGVVSAGFSPDGARVVSASYDNTVRVWRADEVEEPRLLRGHDSDVVMASFSPDGARVVSGAADRTVRVWNADGSGPLLVLRGHDDGVTAASFSPDGAHVVSASYDDTVRVWNADGSGVPMVLRGHDDAVISASFSADGTRVVSASYDKTVRVWSADGGAATRVLRGHDDRVTSASFSADGARVVSASYDKTVRVWRADGSGEPIVLRGHDDGVMSASFSPDGARVVSASYDKTVRVWRADGSGEPIVLRGHDDKVTWAEFSPDGQRIVSASKDKTIRIWQADGSGVPVVLRGHEKWVNKARFSPDGQRVVSASDDWTVRVWHDLTPASLDDPRLWTITNYCMPVARRIDLLGVSERMARDNLARCLAHVAEARR